MINEDLKTSQSAGFTLIEVMITMVIALSILAGLMLNFMSQSKEYRVQDKRVDATQDLELAIRFIASDLQGALVKTTSAELTGSGSASIQFGAASDTDSTGWLSFEVWDTETANKVLADTGVGVANNRTRRCYQFRTSGRSPSTHWQVYYDRHEPNCAANFNLQGFNQVIGEPTTTTGGMRVTHFRIFLDDPNDVSDRVGFLDIPPPLPKRVVRDFKNATYDMPGFTILIEVEIDAVSEKLNTISVDSAGNVSLVDVLSNAILNGKRRVWRYMQVYPAVVVSQ